MKDLWSDNIEDTHAFSDAVILQCIRDLISSCQRESTVIEYKQDLSENDSWSQQAASFANTAGGLIIFGVEGKGDLPVRLSGFDPQNVEIKTKITNTLLSRIQPRPDFLIRVVTHDQDTTKEVAVLRISEGHHPPYMHSQAPRHDIYIREGSRKIYADLLQLNALFEKRNTTSPKGQEYVTDFLNVYGALLNVREPMSNQVTPYSYRIVVAPDDESASRRLTNEIEQHFKESFQTLFPNQRETHIDRMSIATGFLFKSQLGDMKFALRSNGSIGFSTPSCVNSNSTESGPVVLFMIDRFCQDLIHFIVSAALFFERLRYYGSVLINVSLNIPSDAEPLQSDNLFLPHINFANGLNGTAQLRVSIQPLTENSLRGCVESLVNDLARAAGSVTAPNFSAFIDTTIQSALKTVSHS